MKDKLLQRGKEKVKQKIVDHAKDGMSEEVQETVDKFAEKIGDAIDAAKIASQAATGNVVGAVVTTLKNKRFRKVLLVLLAVAVAVWLLSMVLMMSIIMGAVGLFQHPMMSFGTSQSITEVEPNGQRINISFISLANAWTKTIRWDGHTGLTAAEIAQVTSQQLNLSYGLLETFYEIGVRQGAANPVKSLGYVVQQLEPSEISFVPVQLRKVGYSKGKKFYYYVTEQVLKDITRYNGHWVTHYQIITESNGSQIVSSQPPTLQRKDYQPLYRAEQAFDIHQDLLDQQTFFGQALVLDPNFYDPNALPALQMLEGGSTSSSGSSTPPSSGVPMPKPQIIAVLQEAIVIDRVPQSWLPYLEIIVGHEDGSGNPDAVDPILVDGENASGLMQMLPSTFWSDHVSGYNDIWNPLDNAVSAINHIKGAWGSPTNIPGVVSGTYTGY
nr:transglycosylase SLT domain-containing protein [Bacilli bacterium]